MARSTRRIIGVVACLAGCAPAAPAPTPHPHQPLASAAAVPAATAHAAPSARPSATATVEPTDEAAQPEWDNLAGTIDADGPPAPCDYARFYRGTVGPGGYSVVLSRAGERLRGFAAYDAGHGELALVGVVASDGTITLTEQKGGHDVGVMRGACDPATGTITGSWSSGKTKRTLVLEPREAGGVGLVERVRRFGQPLEDAPSCSWHVRSPAVFGLGAPQRAARINRALKVSFGSPYEAELERAVSACEPNTTNTVSGWYSIEVNGHGLLSVLLNGYVYIGPAVHGVFNAAAAAISIDIPTGRKLALTDVVTSSKALRPVVRSCMKLVVEHVGGGDEWWWERAIQGVPTDRHGESVDEGSPQFDPSSLYEPTFLVLPDGMAVLIRNQPTVSSGLELTGPVLRWGALQRAGVVNPRSPIARLWANTAALPPGDPTCVRFFQPRWTVKGTVRTF